MGKQAQSSSKDPPRWPELTTEGDTVEEALAHVQGASVAVVELYEDLGQVLPQVLT
jgi:predicted RNase H-like HicB family nuclease